MLDGKNHLSRPVPGLGNIALSLAAAAATAIASRRVLLLENVSHVGSASFGAPLTELLVETSGWAPYLQRAVAIGVADGFAAHDDFSSFETLCASDLRRTPAARVWRLFSNQYFLPLLLLNPHHQSTVEAMAEPLQVANAGAAYAPSLWTPAVRALWRPATRLVARIDAFRRSSQLDAGPYVAMHIRVNFADQSERSRKLESAIECARSRLRASNSSRLFLATMFASNRHAIQAALQPNGISVHWFGKSMEAQAESTASSDSALADMLLMGGAREVLVTPGSTFGYVVQGLAGRRATLYGGTHTSRDLVGPAARDCSAVRTSEPNFHFLRHALSRYAACRLGAQEARKRGSVIYRLSAMQH